MSMTKDRRKHRRVKNRSGAGGHSDAKGSHRRQGAASSAQHSTSKLRVNGGNDPHQSRAAGRLCVVRRVWAILGAVVVIACGCATGSRPNADQMGRDVAHLEEAFLVLEQLRVRGFRDQDWCRFIDYPRGAFTSDANTSTCNLFDGTPQAFDDPADTDFHRVKAALDETGVSTYLVWWIEYDSAGRMKAAEFDLPSGDLGGRWSYIYDRGGVMPEDDPGESVYTRIKDDWWFWWEDWN